MTYVVDVEVINPFGICLGEDLPKDNYTPYGRFVTNGRELGNYVFWSYTGGFPPRYVSHPAHEWLVDRSTPSTDTIITDYFFQAYDISDNYRNFSWSDAFEPWMTSNENHQRTFETEAEALEYVDTLGNPEPVHIVSNGQDVFSATWEEEINGIWVEKSGQLRYTGDEIVLYTITDFWNFLELFLSAEISWIGRITNSAEDVEEIYGIEPSPVPEINCDPYLKATILEAETDTSIEINIDFTGSSIPGDVTVTIIDGDPIVPLTMLENGPGSVAIADNGNILMLNDGGTFFLNEFGNVGFYANGDASLTADNQVQLGVGQNSVTVESGSLTIRDSSGSATLTAAEINSLKDLLS